MRKRESTEEQVNETAYDTIWREFNASTSNAECDYLTQQLASKLMLVVEEFIDAEYDRRRRLQAERDRQVERWGPPLRDEREVGVS